MDEYLAFLGLSENPFKATPDSRFFFLSESHREALSSIIYGINERKGFILITGEAGVGKTSLIQYLSANLGEKVPAVIIDQPDITIEQLLTQVFLKLGLAPKSPEKYSLIHQLNRYLIQGLIRNENLAILIDQAHKLSRETMEELRLLSNLETTSSKLLQIVLVGRPEIEGKLNSKNLRSFKQRIVIRTKIRPLTEAESRQYIDHHLRLVGSCSLELFTPGALSLICRHAKGIPQAINAICDETFRIGKNLSKKRIDTGVIGRTSKSHFRKISYTMLALACLGMIIFLGRESIRISPEKRTANIPIQKPNAAGNDKGLLRGIKTDFPSNKAGPTPGFRGESSTPQSNQPVPVPSAYRPQSRSERGEKAIKVQKGDTLSSLSIKYYSFANATLVDQILMSNPKISNPHLIIVDQKINIPEITETSLIVRSSDGTYKIHLGTFMNAEYASRYKMEPILKGKGIEVEPRKISTEETWYRVMAEKFDTREECLKTIRILNEKGLLPALEDRGPITPF